MHLFPIHSVDGAMTGVDELWAVGNVGKFD